MFESRVRVVLFVFAFFGAILIARLADLQLVHASYYREKAIGALKLRPKTLEPVRGRILDRLGRELAAEEPCWDIRVSFDVLAMDDEAVDRWARRLERQSYYGRAHDQLDREQRLAHVEQRFRRDVDYMWDQIARFSGDDKRELLDRADRIRRRVHKIRDDVIKRLRYNTVIREERMAHTIVTGLNDQDQIAARALLGDYPWVSIEDASKRVYPGGEPFAHILGRLSYFDPLQEGQTDDRTADREAHDYRTTDHWGVSGVERVAERLLRGTRGRYQETLKGEVVEDIPVENGRDVHLSIRSDLQQRLYRLMADEIAAIPDAPGGAIVVLDVQTREALAMVSYPGYDPDRFRADYNKLVRDTIRQPLRFRAVANHYSPGSIVKPLVCLAGLNSGVIALDTLIECQGYLNPSNRDAWRCWAPSGSSVRKRHGAINPTQAIKYSCNIFMYNVGQMLGVTRLCDVFSLAGFGRASTGLIEETTGIVPWPQWLQQRGRHAGDGKARHLAIGQAEVSITPIQAANLMAVYASGAYRPVTLVRELADGAVEPMPGAPAHWRAIRDGLFGVVNDTDGTAYGSAYWDNPRYALCGKTGSAQTGRKAIEYEALCVDGHGRERTIVLAADSRRFAEDRLQQMFRDDAYAGYAFDRNDINVHAWWPRSEPAEGHLYSNAWFAAYLQEIGADGRPTGRTPRIALAVMVEFGGSGGRVAAPIARKVAQIVVDTLGDTLDPDAPAKTDDEAYDVQVGTFADRTRLHEMDDPDLTSDQPELLDEAFNDAELPEDSSRATGDAVGTSGIGPALIGDTP